MNAKCNALFRQLLHTYGRPPFTQKIPAEVKELLNSEILHTQLGITLGALNTLRPPTDQSQTISAVVDFENHFHLTHYRSDEQKAFQLGIRTMQLLTAKFRKHNIAGITFTYSFQPRALAYMQAVKAGFHNHKDIYYTSDRLSFHHTSADNNIISPELMNSQYGAILVIEI